MCFRTDRAHPHGLVPEGERKGLVGEVHYSSREDPIECVPWLARRRTSAGYSGPTASSSREAWGEGPHKALVGPEEPETHIRVGRIGVEAVERSSPAPAGGIRLAEGTDVAAAGSQVVAAGSLDLKLSGHHDGE